MFGLLDRLHHSWPGRSPSRLLLFTIHWYTFQPLYQWKTAVIRPVAKVRHPVEPLDYRPIYVVPVISRIVQRLVVQTYIYPAFDDDAMRCNLQDQYAFRPTGSTTAAIIAIVIVISRFLKRYLTHLPPLSEIAAALSCN